MTFYRDLGCYACCALGHEHTRVTAGVVLRHAAAHRMTSPRVGGVSPFELANLLEFEPVSDDAWEEDAVADWLNTYAPHPRGTWGWRDGDFGLWRRAP